MRCEELETRRFKVLPVKNEEVLHNIEMVLQKILALTHPSPLPPVGEGKRRGEGAG